MKQQPEPIPVRIVPRPVTPWVAIVVLAAVFAMIGIVAVFPGQPGSYPAPQVHLRQR